MESSLTFTEFVELMLARLVEADRDEPGMWIDLFPLAEKLRQNVPEDWVFEARDALENRGLIHPLKVMGRTAPARLTGEGRLFVEQGGGTGIIGEYRQRPSNFVIVSGSGHQVSVDVGGDVTQTSVHAGVREELSKLLEQIEDGITADRSLGEQQRDDALADVRAARAQLERPEPNKRAVIALLDPLAKLATVGGFVAKLIALLS